MRRQNIEAAAFEVATQVRTVEESIDAALSELAELQSRMVHARSVARVGYVTSQDAFEQLVGTVQALIQARGSMANCHVALAEAKSRVPGLRTVAFGDGEDCPEKPSGQLRIVA